MAISLTLDIIRVFVYTPLIAYYEFNNSTQNLLNNVLSKQSTRLLALFFANLSSQQLKTLHFPLVKFQKRPPYLLFSSNLFFSPENRRYFLSVLVLKFGAANPTYR